MGRNYKKYKSFYERVMVIANLTHDTQIKALSIPDFQYCMENSKEELVKLLLGSGSSLELILRTDDAIVVDAKLRYYRAADEVEQRIKDLSDDTKRLDYLKEELFRNVY